MFSRSLRICFGVGIVPVVFALGLHAVLKFYNAPADAEYDLLNVFAATFASTIPTFLYRGFALRLPGREDRSQT